MECATRTTPTLRSRGGQTFSKCALRHSITRSFSLVSISRVRLRPCKQDIPFNKGVRRLGELPLGLILGIHDRLDAVVRQLLPNEALQIAGEVLERVIAPLSLRQLMHAQYVHKLGAPPRTLKPWMKQSSKTRDDMTGDFSGWPLVPARGFISMLHITGYQHACTGR